MGKKRILWELKGRSTPFLSLSVIQTKITMFKYKVNKFSSYFDLIENSVKKRVKRVQKRLEKKRVRLVVCRFFIHPASISIRSAGKQLFFGVNPLYQCTRKLGEDCQIELSHSLVRAYKQSSHSQRKKNKEGRHLTLRRQSKKG